MKTKTKYAVWKGGTQLVGPPRMHIVAIENGNVRKIVQLGETRSWLERRNGIGVYGSVSNDDFTIEER